MTPNEMIGIFDKYSALLLDRGHCPLRSEADNLNHILWMCDVAKSFAQNGKAKKANRWLGFIQGVLCCKKVYTIEEVKEHNRKKKKIVKGSADGYCAKSSKPIFESKKKESEE